jgi:feruloyl-CoA synthase
VLTADARIRQRVAQGLRALAEEAPGESTHAQRAMLLTEPPSIDANEITDKGYVNQRAVLARRAAAVTDLYRTPSSPEVIALRT